MDFSYIAKAGITQSELAHLCQVTRQTAYGWVTKNRAPHRVHHAKLAKLNKAVNKALADNKLPVPYDLPRVVTEAGLNVRNEVIHTVMTYVRDLK